MTRQLGDKEPEIDQSDPRPLLLLDIDGALCPYDRADKGQPAYYLPCGIYHMWVNPALPAWLAELGKWYQRVWATTWEDPNVGIGEDLGLPLLPAISFAGSDPGRKTDTYKLAKVREVVGDRPLAWIDDQLKSDAVRWAKEREAATLLVRPNRGPGMQAKDFETLLAFGQGLGATGAEKARELPG